MMKAVRSAADSKKVACLPPNPALGKIVFIVAIRNEAPIPVAYSRFMSVTPRFRPRQEWAKNCRPGPKTMGMVRAKSSQFLTEAGMNSGMIHMPWKVRIMITAASGQAIHMLRFCRCKLGSADLLLPVELGPALELLGGLVAQGLDDLDDLTFLHDAA